AGRWRPVRSMDRTWARSDCFARRYSLPEKFRPTRNPRQAASAPPECAHRPRDHHWEAQVHIAYTARYLLACQAIQTVDVIAKDFEGIFDRLRAGHIHAGDFEHFHRRFGGAGFEEIDVILGCARHAAQDAFSDGVCGGDPNGVLERVEINIKMCGERAP